MTKHAKVFLTLIILLTCFGGQIVLGADCAEFTVDVFGYCQYERQLPWFAVGGPWSTTFRWSNTKVDGTVAGGVTIHLSFVPVAGKGPVVPVFEVDNRIIGSTNSLTGVSWPLGPGESVQAKFMYPEVVYQTPDGVWHATDTPDPDTLVVGSIWIRYTATDPEYLRGLAGSTLSFMSKDSTGALHWNAVEEELPPSQHWKASISETYDRATNWQTAETTSAAVSNSDVNAGPLSVEVTLHDEKGVFIATGGFLLQPKATRAFLFRDMFGDNMFPNGKNFTGTATFSATPFLGLGNSSKISVTIFQVVGDSMGNLKAYPVTRP